MLLANDIVGVEGSLSSQNAARFAIEEASLRGVPVIAVCCWEEQCVPSGPALASSQAPGAMRHQAQAQVESAIWPWRRAHPEVTATVSLRAGSPAQVLRDLAEQGSLLVVGARRLSGMPGLWLGSVTQELLQNADRPIAVVR